MSPSRQNIIGDFNCFQTHKVEGDVFLMFSQWCKIFQFSQASSLSLPLLSYPCLISQTFSEFYNSKLFSRIEVIFESVSSSIEPHSRFTHQSPKDKWLYKTSFNPSTVNIQCNDRQISKLFSVTFVTTVFQSSVDLKYPV